MASSQPSDHRRLLPAGQRWGFGSDSVVQYLAHAPGTQSDRNGEATAATISNPVFPHMEKALRALRRRH